MFWPDIDITGLPGLQGKRQNYFPFTITQCYIGYPILYVRVHRGVRLSVKLTPRVHVNVLYYCCVLLL